MSSRTIVEDKKLAGTVKRFLYSQKVAPYVLVSPFIISFLIFFLVPTIQTINMSFHKVISLNSMEFIGIKNYTRLWNVHFFNAIRQTLFIHICVCTMIPIPIILSVILK